MASKELKQMFEELSELVFRIDDLGKDCFINYSGHTKQIDISICDGKWKENSEVKRIGTIYDPKTRTDLVLVIEQRVKFKGIQAYLEEEIERLEEKNENAI